MKRSVGLLPLLALCSLISASVLANIKVSKPESVGMSSASLKHINSTMQHYIEQDQLSGIAILVARKGKVVHLQTQGMRNTEQSLPMTEDTIFRIYSMTKPITAAAALTLWEQGKFHMFDPITKYFPELSDLKVYVSGSGDNMVLEDAKSPIRVIDLFMHTSGFSYGFSQSEVDKLYQASPAMTGEVTETSAWLKEIAKLPLVHQPGTDWNYSISTDLVGLLVERISGMRLGDYMRKVIFEPLGMKDTGFYVAPDKVDRFAEIYTLNKKGQRVVLENEPLGNYKKDPVMHSGGGGLTSTIGDYYRFAQMLLNGGELDGKRILGRKTVEYMRNNHLPDALMPFEDTSPGQGYGLAVSVTVEPRLREMLSSKGNFGWSGLASTFVVMDPKEELVYIAMTQFIPYAYYPYNKPLNNIVYSSLID